MPVEPIPAERAETLGYTGDAYIWRCDECENSRTSNKVYDTASKAASALKDHKDGKHT